MQGIEGAGVATLMNHAQFNTPCTFFECKVSLCTGFN